MDFNETLPIIKIYDKLTHRTFQIHESLASWCGRHGYRFDQVKEGRHERYVVAK